MIQTHDQKLTQVYQHIKKIQAVPQSEWKSQEKFKSLGTESFSYKDADFSEVATYKAEGIVNQSLEKIKKELNDLTPEERMQNDKSIKKCQLIQVTPQGNKIMLEERNVPVISDRQILVIAGVFDKTDDSVTIVSTSIEDENLAPQEKGKVRAKNNYSMFKLEKISENQTKVTTMFNTDPAGSVPGFMKSKMGNKRIEKIFTMIQGAK
ncbi:hypothetical protein PPERSA_01555 [Pseudocohnilembus persalinus]|uniref:START domain-containing protein n=1 Tax=Pseudocohnilembus persalinus TaxID=266149 RepID=A0A0V0QHZ5_PSEPJ|nr:hypothetical protein PPERSA_01555 [Pseudocohnilembus persalinus]|eukprot:KRX01685.1 hypothetical protein PPERSA_01555 [Pseudocohnilembus persalinus]